MTGRTAVLPLEAMAPIPDVIDRARTGDTAAFSELYETYADSVYRYVLYRMRLPADAEDITADVFTRAFTNIHKYRWQGKSFLAWLYTIARNAIIDRRRKDRPTLDIDLAYGLSATGPTAHDHAVRGEVVIALKEAVTRLTGKQRAVLSMRFEDDRSSAQVARKLGKNEGAIRALQFRALARLRKMLALEA